MMSASSALLGSAWLGSVHSLQSRFDQSESKLKKGTILIQCRATLVHRVSQSQLRFVSEPIVSHFLSKACLSSIAKFLFSDHFLSALTPNIFILLLAQSASLHLRTSVLPHTPTDGVARIFSPNSYAATGNRTHIISVATL